MTNIYEFLRDLKEQAQRNNGTVPLVREEGAAVVVLTAEHRRWINAYLLDPDIRIVFTATQVGLTRERDPIYVQHYAIAGEDDEVFCLLSEAMQLNPLFQRLVRGALSFVDTHIPICQKCKERHMELGLCPNPDTWQFAVPKTEGGGQ